MELQSHVAERVLGVLSGGDLSDFLLKKWTHSADVLYAADSGADLLLKNDRTPHFIVGDFDSASPAALASGAELHHRPDPSRSDAQKLLDLVADHGHRSVTLAALEGDLLDHVLGGLNAAVESELAIRFVLRSGIAQIVRAGSPVEVVTQPGRRVSLMPLVGGEATLRGVEWPLHRHVLEAGRMWSLSNRAVEHQVTVEVEGGVALLFVELPPEEHPLW